MIYYNKFSTYLLLTTLLVSGAVRSEGEEPINPIEPVLPTPVQTSTISPSVLSYVINELQEPTAYYSNLNKLNPKIVDLQPMGVSTFQQLNAMPRSVLPSPSPPSNLQTSTGSGNPHTTSSSGNPHIDACVKNPHTCLSSSQPQIIITNTQSPAQVTPTQQPQTAQQIPQQVPTVPSQVPQAIPQFTPPGQGGGVGSGSTTPPAQGGTPPGQGGVAPGQLQSTQTSLAPSNNIYPYWTGPRNPQGFPIPNVPTSSQPHGIKPIKPTHNFQIQYQNNNWIIKSSDPVFLPVEVHEEIGSYLDIPEDFTNERKISISEGNFSLSVIGVTPPSFVYE